VPKGGGLNLLDKYHVCFENACRNQTKVAVCSYLNAAEAMK
jgi:hypothetical protein